MLVLLCLVGEEVEVGKLPLVPLVDFGEVSVGVDLELGAGVAVHPEVAVAVLHVCEDLCHHGRIDQQIDVVVPRYDTVMAVEDGNGQVRSV